MLKLQEIADQRILFSPLNWGYGHVSRSIGLLHQLMAQGNSIFIACDESQRKIYESYFNNVTFIRHDGYPFQFKGKGNFAADIFFGVKELRKRLKEENQAVRDIVENYRIDLVISDHRYGFYSNKVPSVFLTHQMQLPLRWYHFIAKSLHRKYLGQFSSIWILDNKDNSFAGELSKANDFINAVYIGTYSRFLVYSERPNKDIESVLVVSGPTIYGQQLVNEVCSSTDSSADLIIICQDDINVPEGFRQIRGDWRKQDEILLRTKRVISRSGYSTIMDVEELGITASYIPTPGQSEQAYLAQLHS